MDEFHDMIFSIKDKDALFVMGLCFLCRLADKLFSGKVSNDKLMAGKAEAITLDQDGNPKGTTPVEGL